MSLNLLLKWWNLVYVVPFGLALVYLGLYVFTGVTFGDGHDVDMDGDVHVEAHVEGGDVDGDMDGDGDVDADDGEMLAAHGGAAMAHHVHADHDGEGSHEAHGSFVWSVLWLLGAGKIPLSLALMILLILWGSVGFVCNQMLVSVMGATWIVGAISLPVTMVLSVAGTAGLARVLGKFLPTNETYVQKRSALVGQVGEALYPITEAFGMATVRDQSGDLFQVACRTGEGKGTIPKGTKVVLFDYDEGRGVYSVAAYAAASVG